MSAIRILKDKKGILTLDFLFASVLVFAFSALLFSFAFTLSVVEGVQYISYSSARNYSLAHYSVEQQRLRGETKFNELIGQGPFATLVSSNWFEVERVRLGNFNEEYPTSSMDSDNFLGARILFSAPILFKKIPILGITATDPQGFQAQVGSYLAREPTFVECEDFLKQRGPTFVQMGYQVNGVMSIMADNGC